MFRVLGSGGRSGQARVEATGGLKLALPILALWFSLVPPPCQGQAAPDAPGVSEEAAASDDVSSLSLIEVPSLESQSREFMVMITGDGGWAALDNGLSKAMLEKGIPTVGLSSLKYFWTKRTPDESSGALARILRHYLATWHKEKAILVGYSFGADVMPFMVSRLPQDLRQRVELVALLGPSETAGFAFHISEWLLGGSPKDATYPVKPEIQKLTGLKVLCVYGEDDDECCCGELPEGAATLIKLPGAHHFNRDYAELAGLILKERPESPPKTDGKKSGPPAPGR